MAAPEHDSELRGPGDTWPIWRAVLVATLCLATAFLLGLIVHMLQSGNEFGSAVEALAALVGLGFAGLFVATQTRSGARLELAARRYDHAVHGATYVLAATTAVQRTLSSRFVDFRARLDEVAVAHAARTTLPEPHDWDDYDRRGWALGRDEAIRELVSSAVGWELRTGCTLSPEIEQFVALVRRIDNECSGMFTNVTVANSLNKYGLGIGDRVELYVAIKRSEINGAATRIATSVTEVVNARLGSVDRLR